MFCVECGKEKTIFKDGVCKPCYLKTHQFTKGPQYLDITKCSSCNAYKYKNTWYNESFEKTIKRHIKNTFEISKELRQIQITLEYKSEKVKNIPCKITIEGKIENKKIQEQHQITIREHKTNCDVCSRQYGGYYEAIIQIRGENQKLTSKETQKYQTIVENLVHNLQEKGNRGLFITDIGKEQGGIDFFLSDTGAAQSIVKKIQEQTDGQIKQSSKNVGMKDGRQIYRMTYLLRLPDYQIGDIIKLNKKYFQITAIQKNKIKTINLATWNELIISKKDLQKGVIKRLDELEKDYIVVSQTDKEIQLMNPETYKIFDILKPKPIDYSSEKIIAIQINDKFFLIPEKT